MSAMTEMNWPKTNWAENLRYQAETIHHPESVGEVQELVASLPRVKALGTRHSFNAVADSPEGGLISLSRFEPDITIDRETMTVSVSPGASYGVLAAALQEAGFALPNLASLPHISIVGGTATGTHGSGDGNGILATAIRSFELVKADGSLVTVDGPDLKALAVGLGAFGVVTRVTLEIQPTFQVRQDMYTGAPWDQVLESFDETMSSAYSVNLLGDYGAPDLRVIWRKSSVAPGSMGEAPDTLCGGTWYDGADEPPHPSRTVIGGIPGPWSDRLAHFRLDSAPSVGGDELQTEYFVPRRHGVAALNALRRMGHQISPHLHASEIRTVAADDIWLSPAYERDVVSIGFTWRKHPTEVHALLPAVEKALEPFDPRPHWGKLFRLGDLSARFPKLGEFLELRDSYDPTGKFRHGFVQEILSS
jgi:xylitol oxidase